MQDNLQWREAFSRTCANLILGLPASGLPGCMVNPLLLEDLPSGHLSAADSCNVPEGLFEHILANGHALQRGAVGGGCSGWG